MAISPTYTLIPLDRAAAILGLDLYHFNTIVTARRPENSSCDDIWFNLASQRIGQAGREDLASALYEAERQTMRYLRYSPMPTWISHEEHPVTKPFAVELRNYSGLNSRGKQKSIRTNYGYVLEVGSRAKTLIEAQSAVIYSDVDGDGYLETATVSATTTLTDEQEIRVYFQGHSGKDAYEIRPIDISIASGTVTITFPKYLAPLHELWERDPAEADPVWRTIDGDDDDNFVTSVDIYRVYTDPATHATFYHEDTCSSCGGSGCAVCEFTTETACLRIRDSRIGFMSYAPATWNTTTLEYDSGSCCSNDPDKIIINYRAGLVNRELEFPYRQMDPAWERAIVYYAATLLERAGNLCGNAQNIYQQYNEDMALSADGRSWTIAFKNLQNPLGTTKAAIKLWRMIEKDRLL